MPKKPITAEREIFMLERRVFKLEQRLASQKAKYEKQIAKLKARKQPVITEEERKKLITRRDTALAANRMQSQNRR